MIEGKNCKDCRPSIANEKHTWTEFNLKGAGKKNSMPNICEGEPKIIQDGWYVNGICSYKSSDILYKGKNINKNGLYIFNNGKNSITAKNVKEI